MTSHILGGGAAEAVGLHRTYQLPLPDLWRTIAEGHRAGPPPGAEVHTRWGRAFPWAATTELSSTGLPDPILVGPPDQRYLRLRDVSGGDVTDDALAFAHKRTLL